MSVTPSRTCAACRSELATDAVKCAKCGEWRQDVKSDRNRSYFWSFVACAAVLVFVMGAKGSWWPPAVGRGDIVGALTSPAFSPATFLASPSGLALVAAFVIATALCVRYYVAYSRKTGSWFWI